MVSPSNTKELLRKIIALTDGAGSDARAEGLQRLGKLETSEVVQALCEMLADADRDVRMGASELLMSVDRQVAVPRICRLLEDQSDEVRWFICSLVHEARDSAALPSIRNSARSDKCPDIRYYATWIIGHLGDLSDISLLREIASNDLGVDFEGRSISELANEALEEIRVRGLQKE